MTNFEAQFCGVLVSFFFCEMYEIFLIEFYFSDISMNRVCFLRASLVPEPISTAKVFQIYQGLSLKWKKPGKAIISIICNIKTTETHVTMD